MALGADETPRIIIFSIHAGVSKLPPGFKFLQKNEASECGQLVKNGLVVLASEFVVFKSELSMDETSTSVLERVVVIDVKITLGLILMNNYFRSDL
jgi:hypothetical protein